MIRLLKILRRRPNTKNIRPVVLVTGCSSGIGLALARMLYACDEYRVVVTARKNSLTKLSEETFKDNDRFLVRPLDVTEETDRARLIDEINSRWGGVNILINNAGISYRAVVEHMTEEEEKHQLLVNYIGPMEMIRLVLPYMRSLGRGKIINVSSVSGMLAMPTMSSYSASKFALEGGTEALWYELRPLGIDVSLIQPGFIQSSSFRNVYYSKKASLCDLKTGEYCDYYAHMAPFVERMMNRSLTKPEHVARKILSVIKTEKPQLRIPATPDAIVFYYLRRIFPRRLFHRFLFWTLPNTKDWGKHYSNKRKVR